MSRAESRRTSGASRSTNPHASTPAGRSSARKSRRSSTAACCCHATSPSSTTCSAAPSFETGYKAFLCWREFGYPGEPVKNLFAMPALRGSDGAFLLGRMSAATANAGRLYFPAGTPEPADVGADGFVDYRGSILRELEEETGIAPDEVTLDPRWTLVFAGPLVACMKVVRSPLRSAQLIERVAGFVAAQDEPELDGLVAVAGPDDFDDAHMPPFMLHYLREALR